MQMLMWVAAAARKENVVSSATTILYCPTSNSDSVEATVRNPMKMPRSSGEPYQQRVLQKN